MSDKLTFTAAVQKGYSFKGEAVQIGAAILDGEVLPEAKVFLPLKTMNRHGLIAGATGTGKTKTLQMISEHLCDASVPVLLMDIKGDLSGIAAEGAINDKIRGSLCENAIDLYAGKIPGRIIIAYRQGRRKTSGNSYGIWPCAAKQDPRTE